MNATRTVGLWLDNDEGLYNYWRETAIEHWHNADAEPGEDRREMATNSLAKHMRDELGECPDSLSGFHADLMNHALGEVDWIELATDQLESLDLEEPEPDESEECEWCGGVVTWNGYKGDRDRPLDLRSYSSSARFWHADCRKYEEEARQCANAKE